MKKRRLLVIGAVMAFLGIGFGSYFDLLRAQEIPNVSGITSQQAKEIMETEKDLIILDVRTPGEFTGPLGHLKGAKLIPVQVLKDNLDKIEGYKDKKLLVVCHSGVRSTSASKILSDAGFKNILNIVDGMVGMNKVNADIER